MDMKQEGRMITKKNIVLKNGQSVKLEFYQFPELYSVYAVDKNENVVGILSFEIMQKYVSPLSKEEILALMLKNPSSIPKKELEINVFQSSMNMFDIKGDILTFEGRKYELKTSLAILDLIEIKFKEFFQVGLGSAMHNELEDFARNEGCSEIRLASFYPIGEFAHGARPFYEHKGYVFNNNDGVFEVYKALEERPKTQSVELLATTSKGTKFSAPEIQNAEEVFETSKFSFSGTPINQKYLKSEKQK